MGVVDGGTDYLVVDTCCQTTDPAFGGLLLLDLEFTYPYLFEIRILHYSITTCSPRKSQPLLNVDVHCISGSFGSEYPSLLQLPKPSGLSLWL